MQNMQKSADPGLRQGRGGAWDHRRCGTCSVSGPSNASNRLMQLRPGAQAIAIWVCHSHLLLLRRSSLPFARLQRPKTLRGSFDRQLSGHSHLLLSAFEAALKGLKPAAAASTRYSCHSHLLLSAFEAAVCPPSKA